MIWCISRVYEEYEEDPENEFELRLKNDNGEEYFNVPEEEKAKIKEIEYACKIIANKKTRDIYDLYGEQGIKQYEKLGDDFDAQKLLDSGELTPIPNPENIHNSYCKFSDLMHLSEKERIRKIRKRKKKLKREGETSIPVKIFICVMVILLAPLFFILGEGDDIDNNSIAAGERAKGRVLSLI